MIAEKIQGIHVKDGNTLSICGDSFDSGRQSVAVEPGIDALLARLSSAADRSRIADDAGSITSIQVESCEPET
jgi:hypothetical protein